MSSPDNDEEKRRDEILRRLLKTPPQPRPKRERDKPADKAGNNGGDRRPKPKSN